MQERAYDLLIRGGTVIDGNGAPGVRADVAVRGAFIAAVGQIDGPARRTIDADGRAVTPGFIDVHAHDDAAVLSTGMDFKLMQGVTTDIVGNCGAGVAPALDGGVRGLPGVEMILGPLPEGTWQTFGEYMDAVEAARPAVNVGCFVPHGIVHARHVGMERRLPELEQMSAMKRDVEEGMAAGALGMSTGLIYLPGRFAETDEIVALAQVVADHGGIYMSHIRDEAEYLLRAVEEAITIGREAGCPIEISHHKASGRSAWGKTADSIKVIEKAREAGTDVTFDVYPYTAGSTILAAARGVSREIEPDSIMVASVREHREYEGKTLEQIGALIGMDDVQDVISRVLTEEPAAVAIFFSMHETDVRRVLAHPLCMIGSDGIPSPTGKPHPRLYGTFPRVLGKYVREEKLISLQEGVRKMTSLPARRMNLPDRGELRAGFAADIVVFDPDTIADLATYEEPRQYPAGIDYVIVNGEVAAENGRQTSARAGRLLRRGAQA
jgi:N-acyl-D-amino-acid deacylase